MEEFVGKVGQLVEITWLGRGGQGAVTAAELLAIAAIEEGKTAVAIPEFGAERRGAPVRAYNRLSNQRKELPKTPIVSPDILVIIDPSLISRAGNYINFERIRYLVANTSVTREDLAKLLGIKMPLENIFPVDGAKIAMQIFGRPIYNTVMLGALVGSVPLVKATSLESAVKKNFSGKLVEMNLKAIFEGMNKVREVEKEGIKV
ncbi:MAG: 2-oxoacid:acceptor oxidoreductase family protein [Fervidicoccaceae archaeon]